jgi:cardiolipin synthase
LPVIVFSIIKEPMARVWSFFNKILKIRALLKEGASLFHYISGITRHIPNLLTLGRLGLTPFILISLGKEAPDFKGAFFLFLLAAFSDFFDGFWARKAGLESALGAFLDPLADKIFLMSLFAILAWKGLLPFFLVASVFLRDAGILLGVFFLKKSRHPLEIKPLFVSKINTAFQMLLIGLILLRGAYGYGTIGNNILQGMIGLTFLTTLVSGVLYGKQGWRLWQKIPLLS